MTLGLLARTLANTLQRNHKQIPSCSLCCRRYYCSRDSDEITSWIVKLEWLKNIWMVQVRVNALLCLGEVVPRLDKVAVLEVLQTLQRCTAVDHSAPTLMCTLGVCSAIHKQVG